MSFKHAFGEYKQRQRFMTFSLREAILQKIPFFYEILSQTGGAGQPDFISLIQKLFKLVKPSIFQRPTHLRIDFIIF